MYTNDIFKMMILYSVLLLIVNITYLYMFQHSRLVICNKKNTNAVNCESVWISASVYTGSIKCVTVLVFTFSWTKVLAAR